VTNFLLLGEGIPLERVREIEAPSYKSPYFSAIVSSSMRTVADRHRHATHYNLTSTGFELFSGINIRALERP